MSGRNNCSRRRVLKEIGGTAITSGVILTTPASAEEQVIEQEYDENKRMGYAKGTHDDPITVDQIKEIQKKALQNKPENASSGIAIHDPTAERKEYEKQDDEKDILGYAITWDDGAPQTMIRYGPQSSTDLTLNTQRSGVKKDEKRAHDAVDEFVDEGGIDRNTTTFSTSDTSGISIQSAPDPSDDWDKINSHSGDSPVSHPCRDTQIGYIELYSELYKNTSEEQSSTTDWAVTQTGHMTPSCDSSSMSSDFRNEETVQIQNWTISDLAPVDHLDHAPVRDKETSFDTTISASYGSGSIDMSYKIPYIKRDVQYSPEEKVKTKYGYPYKWGSDQAQTSSCNHEQVSIWRTENPSDGDLVTPTYYYGEFSNTYTCGESLVSNFSTVAGYLRYREENDDS